MAAASRLDLLEATALTAAGPTLGSAKSLGPKQRIVHGELIVSVCNAATTVTALVEHSADGTNWYTLISFTAVAGAAAKELKTITLGAHLGQVRSSVALAGVTKAATCAIALHYEDSK